MPRNTTSIVITFNRCRSWRVSLGIVLPVALGGCPATGPIASGSVAFVDEGSGLRQVASSVVFPASVRDFARASADSYNQAGTDVSVGYNLLRPGAGVVATVYVYPAAAAVSIAAQGQAAEDVLARLTRNEFQTREQEIFRAHAGAVLLHEDRATIIERGVVYNGWHAVFRYRQHMRWGDVALRSELYVFDFIANRWSLEYRFSYGETIDARRDIEGLMQSLQINPNT